VTQNVATPTSWKLQPRLGHCSNYLRRLLKIELVDEKHAFCCAATYIALYAVGAFSLVQSQALQPGDRIVVLKDEANPSAGFRVVAVVSAERVKADGYYVPGIGRGFLIADGVVAPR